MQVQALEPNQLDITVELVCLYSSLAHICLQCCYRTQLDLSTGEVVVTELMNTHGEENEFASVRPCSIRK